METDFQLPKIDVIAKIISFVTFCYIFGSANPSDVSVDTSGCSK